MNKVVCLGVDIAGADNTWVAGIARSDSGLDVVLPPQLMTLDGIVAYCQQEQVVAVAIDGQLSMATSDERGFRASDKELRELLPRQNRNWVASFNSLMAVPMRSMLLAERLTPDVGTMLEVHPRASMWFAFSESMPLAVRRYKKHEDAPQHVASLWKGWSERYGIRSDVAPTTDGGIDAIVCATVAWLYGNRPDTLHFLRHPATHKTGYGPFYVLRPTN